MERDMPRLDAQRIVVWTLAGLLAIVIATALDPVRAAIRKAWKPRRIPPKNAGSNDKIPPEKSGFQALTNAFVYSPEAQAGDFHKPLRMLVDFPGVKDPRLRTRETSKLQASDTIIGLVVNGAAFAFSRAALSEPTKHIVNLQLAGQPFAVTYCDLADCARVLTAPASNRSDFEVHVGGIDNQDQLVLLLDGIRYGQESPDIPLQDYKFETMSWRSWTERYPDTQVYDGLE